MDPFYHALFFYVYAGIACLFAFGVLFSPNVVRMAFYLIISLAATAGLHFLAGADFVGAMQLVLYVGGTLVLLIFGVMLTAQSPFISIRTSSGDWVIAALVGGAALAVLVPLVVQLGDVGPSTAEMGLPKPTATRIGLAFLGVPTQEGSDRAGYLLPFEIISIHLLVVLVGAAYLARPKRRAREAGRGSEDAS